MQTRFCLNDQIFKLTFGFGALFPLLNASYIPQVTCYIVLIDRTFSQSQLNWIYKLVGHQNSMSAKGTTLHTNVTDHTDSFISQNQVP